jgi:hypothetical protein
MRPARRLDDAAAFVEGYASADSGLELMVVVGRSGCHDGQHDDGITR